MIYALIFYWITAGIAVFVTPVKGAKNDFAELAVCMIFGGFMIPARLLVKFL